MRIGSNCFIVRCDIARTMRKLCKLIEKGPIYYIVCAKDDPNEKYFVLPNHLRSPIDDETNTRLYN